MFTERNKLIAQRVYELFNADDMDGFDHLFSPDVVDHDPFPGQGLGIEGVRQAFGIFRSSFPDMRITVDAVLAEGDLVTQRLTARATNSGNFLGAPASGKPVMIKSIVMYRIADGMIMEMWHLEDIMGLMIQLGLNPLTGQPD